METIEYLVPPAVLNRGRGSFDFMPCQDDIYCIPADWLRANASRFHFTDQQIIDAARPDFIGDNIAEYMKCCGLYFLIENNEICYVGQSTNIETRIDQHRKSGMTFDFLTWFETPELFRKAIEAYYIQRIKPRKNTDTPYSKTFGGYVKHLD